MGIVRELADQLWTGAVSTLERHPFTPLMVLEEIADRAAFVSSMANVVALDTAEGLLLVDTGGFVFAPMVYGSLRNWSARPLHTAVYTHGHIDHVFGVERFDAEAVEKGWPRPQVVSHSALPARFDRYKLTSGYNSCINSRQFRATVAWPVEYRYPDVTYDRTHVIIAGDERIELHHARGETDDHSWVWIPARKLLCTGDLFIWATPNAGNPQKVQRYPREWAAALREMAALGAEVLSPGHGVPIYGAGRVAQALSETAELLESLHDQTLAMMNAGAALDEILHTVRAPAHLLERPYLRPVYDEPEFIVRNLWRLYGGWYDGNPANLKPSPARVLAGELAALAGGATRLAQRAETLASAGDLQLACHLIELAAQSAPGDVSIKRLRADLYRRRADTETSLMAQAIFRSTADDG